MIDISCTGTGGTYYNQCPQGWGLTSTCCANCTWTCTIVFVGRTPVAMGTFTGEPEPEKQEEYHLKPIDPELIKLRRKLSFQRKHYKSRFYSKPRLKRRALISFSGWLTRVEYKRKKGYSKK